MSLVVLTVAAAAEARTAPRKAPTAGKSVASKRSAAPTASRAPKGGTVRRAPAPTVARRVAPHGKVRLATRAGRPRARQALGAPVATDRRVITARSAILIDGRTGDVLWQRDPDLQLPPASTTKIMTALLALQSGRLDDPFVVSEEAAGAPPSKISLRPGWEMRLRDLVYAVLLNSANDASIVIAEGLAGSVPAFADRMNSRARYLGAYNTHFVNPNGLPADDHYSTARDLVTIFAQGLRTPQFEEVLGTRTSLAMPISGAYRVISLRTHNRLLDHYRVQVIGKTGWTRAAKKCFVGAAQGDGRELLVAVLGSTDLWGDLKRLIDYGLDGGEPPAQAPALLEAAAPADPDAVGDDDEAPPSRTTTYAVQLAALRDLATARRVHESAVRSGYPARIEKVGSSRRPAFRVSVGTFRSVFAAQQAATNLRRTVPTVSGRVVSVP